MEQTQEHIDAMARICACMTLEEMQNAAFTYKSLVEIVQRRDVSVGKLRMLLAACNRIEAEAEEWETPDGFEMGIPMDFWHEFEESLDEARTAISANHHEKEQ